jgi:small conductance mechanosensitive channel
MEQLSAYKDRFIDWMFLFGPKIIGAILVFILGLYITNWLSRQVTRAMNRRQLDVSLQSFLSSMVGVGLKILLLITVAGMLGIQTTSFIAVVGAMGLAVGLALQGSLANFAGGVLILIFKPFKVGDLIEAQGQTGVVSEIQIFNTILLTPENKTVILSNGAVSNNTIINYSRHGTLRVDLTMAVSPSNDIQKVKKVVVDAMVSHPKVLKDPKPSVNILRVGDGMVTLAIRPYAAVGDYWDVYFDLQEKLKNGFDSNNIAAPMPTHIVLNK